MKRVVAVVASAATDPLALAMLEDVVDLVAQMREVDAALVVPQEADDAVRGVTWPTMTVVEATGDATAATLLDAVAAVTDAGEVALVVADVPDLPALLLGKLHSALTTAQVAVCPADDGRAVAVAARPPGPSWFAGTGLRLDDGDAVRRLRAAAPPRALFVGPGWHRVRDRTDALRLDPGLEGWDATRALLGR
jgi:glycosyltransferase A (GT-A) superfamily protein (DUF2064 family)